MIVCKVVVACGIFITTMTLDGKVIKESDVNYLADFSESYKKECASPKAKYDRVLVDKSECVK